ncbi:autolysin [Solibacillus sp. R5-41]|uniref:glucosaminidase domain-containing protein n=1 Tax=Solibacillus sp. R5-41 TaxID=2048654 RepID=UPI000C12846E|nr:glucosaminidase domain-containing protein [Solibacillus sp. R5-41]ATP40621.1 autolysin [Solibacillus sp. R5-41]
MAFIRKILLTFLILGVVFGLLIFGLNYFLFTPSNTAAPQQIEEGPAVEQFIGEIGETARKLGAENDLYASVMIAQAILESKSGQSGLAASPNYNLFGIKGQYQNSSVVLETLEDDGAGNMTTIQAKFRKYASYEESLKDYVNLLRNGVSWNKNYYTSVFKSNTASYKDATLFLTGSYATDSKYNDKLNALIAQYDLAQYDKPIQSKKTIQVADGDSLPLIAEANDVTVTSIMQWNQLNSNFIEAGQTLTIYY